MSFNDAYESEIQPPDIKNPVERILRESGARYGATGDARELGGGQSDLTGLAPDFETGVDDDGNDTDSFALYLDDLYDPTRFLVTSDRVFDYGD